MFTKTARFYDVIYGFKNYDREAEILLEMLSSKVGGSLLDVACGSGKHLERLRDHFTKTEGNVSVIEFEYLISSHDGIERASEVHRLGLFTREEYLEAFSKAGLETQFIEPGLTGRGLFVGQKQVG
jgi:hypothetical protein